MSRRRRYIPANKLYEISFRARSTLPFGCTEYMKLILNGILARVQRDGKVVLHEFVFEGSHPHFLVTAKDAYQCQAFYAEIQKQTTEAVKRLLNLEQLNLWEGRASVIRLDRLEDAINKIAYMYANPSNDDLETCIERYPGLTSWQARLTTTGVDDVVVESHPWIQQPMIPALRAPAVSFEQDRSLCRKMRERAVEHHLLRIEPHSWIKHFIDDPSAEEVARITQGITIELRRRENDNSLRRRKDGESVLGSKQLRRQPLLKSHTPKKKGRKIFVQSMFKDVRERIIKEMEHIDALCREVYRRWKRGDFGVPWPPGAFPPPLPPLANAVFA